MSDILDGANLSIAERAGQLAAAQATQEIASTICAVCGSEKWAFSAFCRSCSIRLQRARMSDVLLDIFMICRARDTQALTRLGRNLAIRKYDAAKDFLVGTRKSSNKATKRDSDQTE